MFGEGPIHQNRRLRHTIDSRTRWYGADSPRIIDIGGPQTRAAADHTDLSVHTRRAGKEGRMPLSDHEQRMLDQIESALYAEDPKFASSVRGGTLRAPSARRRLQGAALFVLGLAMLVAGVPFYTNVNHAFLIVSIVGFIVMFAGVVFAVTGPRVAGTDKSATGGPAAPRAKKAKGSGGSFTSRMEDRFRRRFDE
jgi:hypothetical protein